MSVDKSLFYHYKIAEVSKNVWLHILLSFQQNFVYFGAFVLLSHLNIKLIFQEKKRSC